MTDPGQLSSAFIQGPSLTSDQLDVENDLIAYFWWDPVHSEYIMATVSPQDLMTAMSNG